ncbi:MAG: hypothetical protein A3H67_00225 [Candidatus Buchananbacteria bacterium RIFCSPLOWO2_02_FULL_46_11b]|uniref:Uncharacterized protein n=1 Tax=Candidatus Buchananbacteria bacterium RIFCSPLOWO2_02_FULL_46_11b TaxID=1797548 RepID=A0A1G1YZR7_9BACT|nr:MAG: hypothetical protein A3H67_00225 [Candidatus Buchananbacteria bacterium RIFCSPLOWO2_02_FULL_46_11b]
MSAFKSVSAKNRSKAPAKITNPGGTGILFCVISPKDAPLPPASLTSRFEILENGRMKVWGIGVFDNDFILAQIER